MEDPDQMLLSVYSDLGVEFDQVCLSQYLG